MTAPEPRVRVLSGVSEIASAAAEELIAASARHSYERPCRVLLSGGTTPEPLYRLLATEPTRSRVDWTALECFLGDERSVPPDHPDSNYGLVKRTLLEPLGLMAPRTYRIRGEQTDLEIAARRYEALIRSRTGTYPPDDPVLDLVFLGLGRDGHTASLFPGVSIPDDPPRLVVAVHVEALQTMRATVTYRILNAARRVLFLVSGSEKAEALRRTLAPEPGEEPTPASRVAPREGEVIWLCDREAASGLTVTGSGAPRGRR
jgi:6-phosphogluconolactonase